jgi:hypothetical protein
MSADINPVSAPMGAFTGSTAHPLIFIPPNKGAITLTDVKVVGDGAGTAVGLVLTKMTAAGTPAVSEVLASFEGTIVYAEGVVHTAAIANPKVDPGTTGAWLGVDQTSGTAPANTVLSVNFVQGV